MFKNKKIITFYLLGFLITGLMPLNCHASKPIKGLILKENRSGFDDSLIISDPDKDLFLNDYLINNLNFNYADVQLFNILLTKNLDKIEKKPPQDSETQDSTRIYNVKLTRQSSAKEVVITKNTPKTSSAQLADIGDLIKNHKYAQAEKSLDDLDKNDTATALEAAGLYESIHKNTKALKLYEQIAAKSPNRIEFLYLYALCLFKNNDYSQSITVLNSINKINPNFMLSHYTLGNVYFTRKDYINALRCFQKALMLNPLSADTSYNMGLTLENLGYKNLASKFYKNCVKLNPKDTDAVAAAKRLSV